MLGLLVLLAQKVFNQGFVEPRIIVLRAFFQRRVVGGERFLELSLTGQRIAQVVAGFGIGALVQRIGRCLIVALPVIRGPAPTRVLEVVCRLGVILALEFALSGLVGTCLLYTSPSPRDVEESRMPSSA